MGKADSSQLNVRSRFAKERAGCLARDTGMSVTQVVEEALRAYQPPGSGTPPGMIRCGPILVHESTGRKVSVSAVEAALEELRSGIR